jgi:uncharacterized protein YfaS (alpha-2-macroglobulin family)
MNLNLLKVMGMGILMGLLSWGIVGEPIALSTDKDIYKPGEEVRIFIKNVSKKAIGESITLRITSEKGEIADETVFMLGWSPLEPGKTLNYTWSPTKDLSEGNYLITASLPKSDIKVSKKIEIREYVE